MERQRLDRALEARGLIQSRARARDAILRGTVQVNGVIATKPHQPIAESDIITLDDAAAAYVSRAALKLIAGLDAGDVAVAGRTCLDVGSSTGGFTQVLVERGAARIYAVDVGQDQLHQKLRSLPQVISLESQNARALDRALVPDPIDLLVCDVSFVSVTKVLAAPLSLCTGDADAVILIKPQFEVGPEHIGKGGLVTNEAAIANANESVIAFMAEAGWALRQSLPSPITGGDGNRETVAMFRRGAG
ncbi:23S rRNA (cytidine1920-2'-O)/16S rRNA (cytidine1409-2'-O)-methyltransferase [Devosia enhydra]|uniref:23S rRNA (Cytidine1920-2'-O)/16S rRNA (Cytidine1409-2'-O)-methyltransferase n=1 Tax=Devosia enhydra TaxID=665118 RepID=A0A1K2I161_9HYPH|nr:TlyA family RNA methyltransferase [Devosia enhydra]SFZ86064.1 23S rRNA (cytidine1920-2'-O)/16S rRNA (cytidine1409-2'-O)-methyltransferase [Devosia enhydra]